MPQPGERKVKDGITGEWDGQTWRQVSGTSAPAQPEGAVSRFASGAASTSPFNPMNALHAMMHPIDTVGGMVSNSLHQAGDAAGHIKNAVTNPGNEDWLGRLTEMVQGVEHAGGAVPGIGPAGIDAGEKIGNGDIAGGTGELAGLASGALLPKVPKGMSATGGLMERGGTALANASMHSPLGNLTVPMAGLAEAAIRHDPYGLAVAGAPYALKYGGKGLKMAGDALQGLGRSPVQGEVVPPPFEEGVFKEKASGRPAGPSSLSNHPALDAHPQGLLPEGPSQPQLGPGAAASGPFEQPASSLPEQGALPASPDRLALPPAKGFQMPPSSLRFMSDINPDELGFKGDLPNAEPELVDADQPPSSAGQDVPSADDVEGLVRGLLPSPAATAAPEASAAPPSIRALNRGDDFWGPGSKSRSGDLSMADESNRTIYDPQTPNSYLRDQLKTASDPAEQAFLLRAYRQRLNIANRPGASPDATGVSR